MENQTAEMVYWMVTGDKVLEIIRNTNVHGEKVEITIFQRGLRYFWHAEVTYGGIDQGACDCLKGSLVYEKCVKSALSCLEIPVPMLYAK